MATVSEILYDALFDSGIVGVGQTPLAEDLSRAFRLYQQLISQWNRKRWLVFHLIDAAVTSTGALSYSVGPGGDIDVPRPDRIEFAFFRQLIPSGTSPIDYVLRVIQSREDYDRIVLKNMGTWPDAVFYDSAWPMGFIYVWPVPQASIYQIHLTLKDTLNTASAPTGDVGLPPEYEPAILYELVCRLRAAYQMSPDPVMIGLAKDALNVLRGANAQISTLTMPRGVLPRGRSYNLYSDDN